MIDFWVKKLQRQFNGQKAGFSSGVGKIEHQMENNEPRDIPHTLFK